MKTLNCFEHEGKTYMRVTPAKSLVRSNMVYEVLARGDVFAVELPSGRLTILPGKGKIKPKEIKIESQGSLF